MSYQAIALHSWVSVVHYSIFIFRINPFKMIASLNLVKKSYHTKRRKTCKYYNTRHMESPLSSSHLLMVVLEREFIQWILHSLSQHSVKIYPLSGMIILETAWPFIRTLCQNIAKQQTREKKTCRCGYKILSFLLMQD